MEKLLFGLIGTVVGIMLKGSYDFYISKKKNLFESKLDFRETRYKAILLLMYSLVNWEKEKERLGRHRPEVKTTDDLLDELKAEWANMILYASDAVIKGMKTFLQNPNIDTFGGVLLLLRRDLYLMKSNLKKDEIKL